MITLKTINPNVTNCDPAGYRDLMEYEDLLQNESDILEEDKEAALEKLEDDELVVISDEAFGELLNSKHCAEIQKVMNEIVKAVILGGHYKDQPLSKILSHLSLESEKLLSEYVINHAKYAS